MRQIFSKYSIKFLITVPIIILLLVGLSTFFWLNNHYQKRVLELFQTQNANLIASYLIPSVEERIHDSKALKLFLQEVINNNPEIFYVGLLNQNRYYAHASSNSTSFNEDAIHIKQPLTQYPHIFLEILLNPNLTQAMAQTIYPLPWHGIGIGVGIVIIALIWTLFILNPLDRLSKRLSLHTDNFKNNQNRSKKNELLLIAQSVRTLTSSNRVQKHRLKRLNSHLEELIHAKTSSLKAEIEENMRAKKRLEISNEEKTILLKEVHHRVKNNLAIIVGLIRMQSRRIDDKKTKSMFMDLQNRIKTMELIHTSLYTTAQFNKIMMKEYLSLLVKHLSHSFEKDELVMFSIQCEDISMEIDQAITCGQIINELVTNAYKHAFKGLDSGHIWIRIIDLGEHFELQVEDNGSGGSEPSPQSFSLGLSLVHELTRYQLKGTLKVENKEGLKYKIVFRKKQF
jgi:two-component sensor histidine kinase